MQLKDKVILVTGSTTGIGEAIARRAVQLGAKVMLHGTDMDRGQSVASSLEGRAQFLAGDLANADVPQQLIEHTITQYGRLDGLVNNAAWVVRSNIDSTDAALFDRVMSINVRAPFLLIKAAL